MSNFLLLLMPHNNSRHDEKTNVGYKDDYCWSYEGPYEVIIRIQETAVMTMKDRDVNIILIASYYSCVASS